MLSYLKGESTPEKPFTHQFILIADCFGTDKLNPSPCQTSHNIIITLLTFFFQALELSPGEKNCLVARSKCHLQLGDMQSALNDAESSLEEDSKFHKV